MHKMIGKIGYYSTPGGHEHVPRTIARNVSEQKKNSKEMTATAFHWRLNSRGHCCSSC